MVFLWFSYGFRPPPRVFFPSTFPRGAKDGAAWPLALQVLQRTEALGQQLSLVSHNSAIHATGATGLGKRLGKKRGFRQKIFAMDSNYE